MRKAATAACVCLVAQSTVAGAAQYSPEDRYAVELSCFMASGAMFKAKGVERSAAASRFFCRCLVESMEDQISAADLKASGAVQRDLLAHTPLTSEQQAFVDRMRVINGVNRSRCDCYITAEQDVPQHQEPLQSVPFCPN